MSGDVPSLSQRAAFWSTKTVPLSAGTRRGRRGSRQSPGEAISRDKTFIHSQVYEREFTWDCQRHDALGLHPAVGGNAFQVGDHRRRGIGRDRKGFDGGWVEILKEAHRRRWSPSEQPSAPLYMLRKSLPREPDRSLPRESDRSLTQGTL